MNSTALKDLLGRISSDQVIIDPEELIVYDLDAAHSSATPDLVVFPSSTEEVVIAVQWAKEHNLPVVARGAGTGLSGGAVAERGGLLLPFTRMRRILDLDAIGRRALVEPGVVNQHLADFVMSHGMHYPPDPASGRSATLGGNVAENSGGPHCFKYGVTTNYICAIEFVDAEGNLVTVGGNALDYPEYNYISLLTGSEGTLGVITKIGVRLLGQPPDVKTMMVAFDSVQQAGQAVSAMIAAGLVPAALEMMDQKIARIVEDYAHPGIPTDAAAILIIEVDGYPASLDDQIDEIVKIVPSYGGRDLRVAQDEKERQQVWFARKSAIGALARLAPAYLLLDGTVARSKLPEALEITNQICDEHELRVGYVFHAGDGNLHPLILMYPDDPAQVARVHRAGEAFMHAVVRMGGSITGEHGVGIDKRGYLPLMYNPKELEIMRDVKRAFDPENLFNPGKIFPPSTPANENELDAAIPDLPDGSIICPAAAEEAARTFAALTYREAQVRISGSLDESLVSTPGGFVCTTRNLDAISNYDYNELTVTIGAGARLDDVQAYLDQDRLRLAFASPWGDASLGGLIATNTNSPLRMRYGSLADQILAMTIVLGDGRMIRAGRPVVKNVAGYDLPKLMVGSFGSLGLIADITFKLQVRPQACRTLLAPINDLHRGIALGLNCLQKAYVCSGIVLSDANAIQGLTEARFALAYTAEGLPADVDAELDRVGNIMQAAGVSFYKGPELPSATDLWAVLLRNPLDPIKLRVGVPVSHLHGFFETRENVLRGSSFACDIASGLVYISSAQEHIEQFQNILHPLRSAALAVNGYAVVVQAPESWREKLDVWGYMPESFTMMKALKSLWDPADIFSSDFFHRS
jgi:D-lactate dehydrogenase (cytochrome)